MIALNEARITDRMINTVKYWQEGDCIGLEEDVRAIDDAIGFIACEHYDPDVLTEKESLAIIAALSFVRKRLRMFDGKTK